MSCSRSATGRTTESLLAKKGDKANSCNRIFCFLQPLRHHGRQWIGNTWAAAVNKQITFPTFHPKKRGKGSFFLPLLPHLLLLPYKVSSAGVPDSSRHSLTWFNNHITACALIGPWSSQLFFLFLGGGKAERSRPSVAFEKKALSCSSGSRVKSSGSDSDIYTAGSGGRTCVFEFHCTIVQRNAGGQINGVKSERSKKWFMFCCLAARPNKTNTQWRWQQRQQQQGK